MEQYWKKIEQIVIESDIVLYVLDSRLVEQSRNEEIEEILKAHKKPVIYVINKSDLVSKKALEKSLSKLRENYEYVYYLSVKKRNTARNLLASIKRIFKERGKLAETRPRVKGIGPEHRAAKADIVVGVVGYPNVGKSSIINSLSFKKKAKVSSTAGTTHGVHWIASGTEERIKFIDSPGVIPLKYMDETRLGLIGSRNPEKLKDPEVTAMKIIEMFVEKNLGALEEFYDIKIPGELNSCEILEYIGRVKGRLKKGNEVDEARTAIMIVRDWQNGKLRL